jgi:hypothetical protein
MKYCSLEDLEGQFHAKIAMDAKKIARETHERTRKAPLKEEPSEKEKAQQKSQCIYDNFDKAHIISYAKKRESETLTSKLVF